MITIYSNTISTREPYFAIDHNGFCIEINFQCRFPCISYLVDKSKYKELKWRRNALCDKLIERNRVNKIAEFKIYEEMLKIKETHPELFI